MVTGATGFIGRALVGRLAGDPGFSVLAATRGATADWPKSVVPVQIGDLADGPNFMKVLRGVSCVIHAAARVHISSDSGESELAHFRRINVEGTRRLAEQAASMGVRRLVFVSSVKVNGDSTSPGMPFRPSDTPRPECAYGISKWEAEQALARVAQETGLEFVIVRPPLTYGPGVKANFLRLMHLVRKGWPLPLGRVQNRRSLVALDNLVDLLIRCVDHPAAAYRTLLVSDGQDLSTPELIRGVADAMGRPSRLYSVPVPILRGVARMTGRLAEFERLTGSLQVDIRATRETLGWVPPVSVHEGLVRAVNGWR
jgi:nucleoside-diphosphate-sugar epimerase